MVEITGPLLLMALVTAAAANRVYVHPFGMFALGNGSCESTEAPAEKPLHAVSLAPVSDGVEPDPPYAETEPRGNVTQTTSVLAQLLNFLGQRLYGGLRAREAPNAVFSPVNAYGALVTFYLGARGPTAGQLQKLLGLEKETDAADCLSPFDGHKVLRTLRHINGLVDGTTDELRTRAWVFSAANLSESFVRGVRELADTSYTRAADLSQPQAQLAAFVEKTSAGKSKLLLRGVNSTADLLFASSVHFQGERGSFARSLRATRVRKVTRPALPWRACPGE